MVDDERKQRPHSIEGKMEVPYRTYAGDFISRFFIRLRDVKKISGTKCPDCQKVYVPPKSICPGCFKRLKEYIDISDVGTVLTFTEITYSEPTQPVRPPFLLGIVKLDGADTGLVHFIGGDNLSQLAIGTRVQAVYQEERHGNILDIAYFRPL